MCIDAILDIIPSVMCIMNILTEILIFIYPKLTKLFRGGTSVSSLRNYFLHIHQKYIYIYLLLQVLKFLTKFKHLDIIYSIQY